MTTRQRLARSVVANALGRGWSALMALAFVPVYFHLLGSEAYGLIAFYTTLQASFAAVDVGLTTTLNRELSVRAISGKDQGSVLRTLEIVYWTAALLTATLIAASSSWIATSWLHAAALPLSEVRRAVVLMAIVLGFQWPLGFYGGGLLGLERHILFNVVLATTATLRYAGAAAALIVFNADLFTFFVWQATVSAVGAAVTASIIWNVIGRSDTARFSWRTLQEMWRFTLAMGAVSGSALLLTQIDKIVLSSIVSLEMFGYYNAAVIVANSLYVVVAPVGTALFPRLTRELASGAVATAAELYHDASQIASVVVVPLASVIGLFASDIMRLWTGSTAVTSAAGPILTVLVLGTALNALMTIPYTLQLAYGWTRAILLSNLAGLAFVVPALLMLAPRYGGLAAAGAWLALNLGYVSVQMVVVHRRLLPGELAKWYVTDVARPSVAGALIVLLARLVSPELAGVTGLIWLVAITLAGALAAALAAPSARARIVQRLELFAA